jgi:hypothetical protein
MKSSIDTIREELKGKWESLEHLKDYVDVIVDYLRIPTK